MLNSFHFPNKPYSFFLFFFFHGNLFNAYMDNARTEWLLFTQFNLEDVIMCSKNIIGGFKHLYGARAIFIQQQEWNSRCSIRSVAIAAVVVGAAAAVVDSLSIRSKYQISISENNIVASAALRNYISTMKAAASERERRWDFEYTQYLFCIIWNVDTFSFFVSPWILN